MATRLARYSITTAGLSSKIGLAAINQVNSFGNRTALENASEKTAEMVDNEVRTWLDEAHKNATKLLINNKEKVKKLAEELLAKETLTGDEIKEIVLGKKQEKKAKKTPADKTKSIKNEK